jgi:hypothetical protein
MGEQKCMHDAKWVGAMLYGQRTQFADQEQSYLKGKYQDLLKECRQWELHAPIFFPILVTFRRHVFWGTSQRTQQLGDLHLHNNI